MSSRISFLLIAITICAITKSCSSSWASSMKHAIKTAENMAKQKNSNGNTYKSTLIKDFKDATMDLLDKIFGSGAGTKGECAKTIYPAFKNILNSTGNEQFFKQLQQKTNECVAGIYRTGKAKDKYKVTEIMSTVNYALQEISIMFPWNISDDMKKVGEALLQQAEFYNDFIKGAVAKAAKLDLVDEIALNSIERTENEGSNSSYGDFELVLIAMIGMFTGYFCYNYINAKKSVDTRMLAGNMGGVIIR